MRIKQNEDELYKDFICLVEQKATNTKIMRTLKIGQYKCERFFTKYLTAKNREREKKTISKAKVQNIQDGFHPWISKILRVS